MMDTAIDVTVISLNLCNVVLYTIGTYLLVCLYREGLKTPQQIYLLNLAVTELLINFFELLRRLLTKAVLVTDRTNQVGHQHSFLIFHLLGLDIFCDQVIIISLVKGLVIPDQIFSHYL